jgi:hypothetical protein
MTVLGRCTSARTRDGKGAINRAMTAVRCMRCASLPDAFRAGALGHLRLGWSAGLLTRYYPPAHRTQTTPRAPSHWRPRRHTRRLLQGMVKSVRLPLLLQHVGLRRSIAPQPLPAVQPARISYMKTALAAATIEQLRHGTPWCWVDCDRCLHRTPVAFVPFIRWGPDASSDKISVAKRWVGGLTTFHERYRCCANSALS